MPELSNSFANIEVRFYMILYNFGTSVVCRPCGKHYKWTSLTVSIFLNSLKISKPISKPILGMFVLIWMQFSHWLQIYSWNSTILTFFQILYNFGMCRLHAPTGPAVWKTLQVDQPDSECIQQSLWWCIVMFCVHRNDRPPHQTCQLNFVPSSSSFFLPFFKFQKSIIDWCSFSWVL